MRLKGLVLLVAVAGTVAALWPAAGSAATVRGVVVAKQRGTMLVASPSGIVSALPGSAAVGSRITFTSGHARVVGHARIAHLHGIVVRRIGSTMILSSNTHLVAIHKARLLADTNPTTPTAPQPGAVVNTTVTTANGELDEEDEVQVGQVANNNIQVQAVVAAVGTGTLTLTVQGQSLVVPLPAGLTFSASIVGQTVTISLTLADNNDDQGDDNSGDGGGHDGGGDHGGDGGGDG
jgi:hypothetical protein